MIGRQQIIPDATQRFTDETQLSTFIYQTAVSVNVDYPYCLTGVSLFGFCFNCPLQETGTNAKSSTISGERS
jgi:hypothetical protein